MDRNRQTSHNVKSNFRKQFCRTRLYDSIKSLSNSILIKVVSSDTFSKKSFRRDVFEKNQETCIDVLLWSQDHWVPCNDKTEWGTLWSRSLRSFLSISLSVLSSWKTPTTKPKWPKNCVRFKEDSTLILLFFSAMGRPREI